MKSDPAGTVGGDTYLPTARRAKRDSRRPRGRGAPRYTRAVAPIAVGVRASRSAPARARLLLQKHAGAFAGAPAHAPGQGLYRPDAPPSTPVLVMFYLTNAQMNPDRY